MDVKVFGTHDDNTLEQIQKVAEEADAVALMADGHLGYNMPVGGVAGYTDKISVSGVGFDIACGNAAIRTNLCFDDVADDLHKLADEIAGTLSFGVGGTNRCDDAPVDHDLFDHPAWDVIPAKFRGNLRQKARTQLGSVGSGNHYVDVFRDENDAIWVGVHFGSRGLGHTIASNFLAIANGGKWGDRAKETTSLLSIHDPSGSDYLYLMELAGSYAYAGRHWAAQKTVAILGGVNEYMVHNHHNFAWSEHHYDRSMYVVRKGATPAYPGQEGFVGGSMGDDAVILEGAVDAPDDIFALQQQAMFSTVHGAGRVMSRTQAAGKWRLRRGKAPRMIRPGKVSQEDMDAWVNGRGVILRGGGLDESPQAYRRLPDVLEAMGGTITVKHTLTPLIVVMAGRGR